MNEFRTKFGMDFSAEGNAHYKVGEARRVSDSSGLTLAEGVALLETVGKELKMQGLEESVENAIRTTDSGRVSLRTLQFTSGESCVAITYHLGDTLCGLILKGARRVAVISDSFIEPV